MSRSRVDVLFERFRDSGDPRALGRVFDLTAAELFKVAAHLCGDRHGAEDLVQATFVTAIQDARSFAPGRAVLPWFLGILANRARMARRTDERRARRESRRSQATLDPAAEAEARELRESIERALRELPEPYRQVLFLHLEHGLSARVIGEALARPAGTVRTQIVRGMELLRGALPAGFVVGTLLFAAPGQALARVRAAVLENAGTTAVPAASTSLLLGGLVMMKKSLAVTAILLLAGAGLFVELTGDAAPDFPREFHAAHHPGAATAGAGTPALGPNAEGDAGPGPMRSPVASAVEPGTVTLRGRCVDAAGPTAVPLRGCTVAVAGLASDLVRMEKHVALHGDVTWKDPPPQTTGGDGTFSFTFVPPPPHGFVLSITKTGLAPVDAKWTELAPGTVDLGDVPVRSGTFLAGRVVDTTGAPRDGVVVSVSREGRRTPEEGRPHPRRSHDAVTAADGTLRFDEALAAGKWSFSLWEEQLVAAEPLEVADGDPSAFVDLVVWRKSEIPSITGVVVDDAGVPVPGVHVDTVQRSIATGRRNLTDEQGRFRVERRPPRSPEECVYLQAQKDGFEPLGAQLHAWGTSDLKLVLRRGLAVDVLVTDAATGRPVEEFGVRCFPLPAESQPLTRSDFVLRNRGRHAGGLLRVTGLHRGPNLLVVEPVDRGYCVSGFQRFELGEGGAPVQHVRIVRPVARALEVVRRDGLPVAGTAVELLRRMNDHPLELGTQVVELQRIARTNTEKKALLLQRGVTDARGELALSGPPGEQLSLRILGPGHLPAVVQEVLLDPQLRPLRVEASAGASLSGRVRPLQALAQFHPPRELAAAWGGENLKNSMPAVRLERAGSGGFPLSDKVFFAEDGSFALPTIPPGSWDLVLHFGTAFSASFHAIGRERLAALDLADGEARQLDLDLSHLLLGRLEGRVFRAGAPLAGAKLELAGRKPDGAGRERAEGVPSMSLVADAEGRFAADVVSASYSIRVWLGKETVPAVGRAEVVPGGRTQSHFRVRVAPVRLRVMAADGRTPLSGVQVWVASRGGAATAGPGLSGADGWTSLGAVPLGTFTVRAWPKESSSAEAQLELLRRDPNAMETCALALGSFVVEVEDVEVAREVVMPAGSGY